jgi:hypothetical protein
MTVTGKVRKGDMRQESVRLFGLEAPPIAPKNKPGL